jgi:hypothetical protein
MSKRLPTLSVRAHILGIVGGSLPEFKRPTPLHRGSQEDLDGTEVEGLPGGRAYFLAPDAPAYDLPDLVVVEDDQVERLLVPAGGLRWVVLDEETGTRSRARLCGRP